MKKVLSSILLLFVTSFAFSQSVFGLLNKSQDFFDLLGQAKYKEAHAFFDPTVQSKLTPENLQEMWSQMVTKLGPVSSVDVVKSNKEGDNFLVYLDGKFEKGEQRFLLAFNKAESVVGIFLVPGAAAVAYVSPSYIDTASFTSKEIYLETPGHQLAAVLTTPKKMTKFPMVVFVHGSGAQDMDETVGPNKPFKDIAAGLASKGIGSIRYVKRTLVYATEFSKAFTVKEETIDDALAAIALAKKTPGADIQKIFVLGHSLGGMLAPRIAALSPTLGGIILAAAPARKFSDLMASQNKYFFGLAKDTTQEMRLKLDAAMKEIDKSRMVALGNIKPDSIVVGHPAAYWVDLNNYNQVNAAKSLSKPRIMVIQGGMDFQVEKVDYDLWNAALATKKNATLKYYPDLNHLLSPQTEKGTPAQYQVPVNVSETLVNDLAAWIKLK